MKSGLNSQNKIQLQFPAASIRWHHCPLTCSRRSTNRMEKAKRGTFQSCNNFIAQGRFKTKLNQMPKGMFTAAVLQQGAKSFWLKAALSRSHRRSCSN